MWELHTVGKIALEIEARTMPISEPILDESTRALLTRFPKAMRFLQP